MAYVNELLFNNSFLKSIKPSDPAISEAWMFINTTIRDYYRQADFSTPARMIETLIRPILQVQSLDLKPKDTDGNVYHIVAPWDAAKPLGVMLVIPHEKNPDGRDEHGQITKGRHWMAKAVQEARSSGMRWAVLTNGDQWRLLDSDHLRCFESFLEVHIRKLVTTKTQSPDLDLAAYLFLTIFCLSGSFEDGGTGLTQLMDKSIHATEKTEQYLKQAVTDSLDTPGGGDGIMAQLCIGLVQAIDPNGNWHFTETERENIYRDATYLLYRLLFILYAEARHLLPFSGDYPQMGLEHLIGQAVKIHENLAEDPSDMTSLWDSLTALFGLMDIGDIPLDIPPFDGGLFDDSERPYLGKYKINNTFLAAALRQLAFEFDLKTKAILSRIDYRDLSVRHLGSLYEGMIEYRLFIAEEDLLVKREKDGKIRFINAAEAPTGSSGERIKTGQVYFAQSPHERKSTGTHYTPEELVEKLVQQTTMRLLDERWQEFEPQFNSWMEELANLQGIEARSSLQQKIDQALEDFVNKQVLSLRICDPAMGSGHFLVHTAHRMTNYILATLSKTAWENPNLDVSPDAWRLRVVEHCLYGVDINPMAVELAKLSLWLATMHTGRPLSFLDHHLKHGNSLLGVRFKEIVDILQGGTLNQATRKSMIAEARGQYSLVSTENIDRAVEEAVSRLDELMGRDSEHISGVAAQKADYRSARERLQAYRNVGDLLVAVKMGLKAMPGEVYGVAVALERGETPKTEGGNALLEKVRQITVEHPVFHWDLEFPEVFLSGKESGGFNIIVGNPPFLGGSKISTELGSYFLNYLKINFSSSKGRTDLCAYFYLIAYDLMSDPSYCGLLATNTIAQGDTRESGLAVIVSQGGEIFFAEDNIKWPGDANLEVNIVAYKKTIVPGSIEHKLNNQIIPLISSWLDDLPEIRPFRLVTNFGKSFEGDKLDGLGFTMPSDEGKRLIEKNESLASALFPYLIGKDLNENPDSSPDRYAICFHDWPIEKAKLFNELFSIVEKNVKPERIKLKEERTKNNWWLYGRYRKEMRNAIKGLTRILVRSKVSEHHMLIFVPKEYILASRLAVFAFDDYYTFSLLQSSIHEIWLRRHASTLESRICYTTTDCFDTFPFPQKLFNFDTHTKNQFGQEFYDKRKQALFNRNFGLTELYNYYNDPFVTYDDIVCMRNLQIKMDTYILACYGWENIELQYDFYPNDRQKIRFMPSPAAQREIFTRLIALNQQIAAEEAVQGLTPAAMNEDDMEIEE